MPFSRRLLLRLHWFLGLTLGVSLSFIALSGAIISFEDEIMLLLTSEQQLSVPVGSVLLSPGQVIALLSQQHPQEKLVSLLVEQDPRRSWVAVFQRQKGQRNLRVFVDPRNGQILGQASGVSFFNNVRNLHRYFSPYGSNPLGKKLSCVSAVSLIFFALSGLWLRWSAGNRRPRDWFQPDFHLNGRALYSMLHQVFGSWLVVLYLISALSGLWWSSERYRQGLIWLFHSAQTVAKPEPEAGQTERVGETDWDKVWQQVGQHYGAGYRSAQIFMLPAGKAIRIRVLAQDAANAHAFDEVRVNAHTFALNRVTTYRSLSLRERILVDMEAVHRGTLFGLPGRIVMLISSLCLPLFFVTGLLMYWKRRHRHVARNK